MGLILVSPEKITIEKSLRLRFSAINNEVEYEALLMRMTMVKKNGQKGSRDVLGLKVGCWLSEGRVRS